MRTTQPTTHKAAHLKKTPTPWSPSAAGFQRLQIYRWVRSLDVLQWRIISATWRGNFLKGNSYVIFFLQLFFRPLTGALASDKVSFVVNYRVFYFAVVSNRCALTPAVRQYFFRRCPPCPHHVLAWFRTRGWGRHGHHVCARSVVGSLSLSSYFC